MAGRVIILVLVAVICSTGCTTVDKITGLWVVKANQTSYEVLTNKIHEAESELKYRSLMTQELENAKSSQGELEVVLSALGNEAGYKKGELEALKRQTPDVQREIANLMVERGALEREVERFRTELTGMTASEFEKEHTRLRGLIATAKNNAATTGASFPDLQEKLGDTEANMRKYIEKARRDDGR